MVQLFGVEVSPWLELTLAVVGTAVAAYAASRITKTVLRKGGSPVEIAEKSGRIVKYTVWIMGAVLIAFYFTFDILGALVGLGIFGIVIGIGLGTLFGNLVTGIVVVLGRSFRIGDVIKISFFEGRVVKISISKVVLETKDGEVVFVPTAFFLTNPVSRKSREDELRP